MTRTHLPGPLAATEATVIGLTRTACQFVEAVSRRFHPCDAVPSNSP